MPEQTRPLCMHSHGRFDRGAQRRPLSIPSNRGYKGTSRISKRILLGPYSRPMHGAPMHRAIRWP